MIHYDTSQYGSEYYDGNAADDGDENDPDVYIRGTQRLSHRKIKSSTLPPIISFVLAVA